MRLEYQILAAFLLDLLLGDPRWLPHPVRGIGWVALQLEPIARRAIPWARGAGIAMALAVYALAGLGAWGMMALAGKVHPWAADVVAVAIMYTTIAARDLAKHSMAVYRPLKQGDLAAARRSVGMIVGRDTEQLDEAGISRAAVESVAESTVDGVTAPLFYAIVGGPIGAMVYRAINTLDSTFGYRDKRYIQFGWASARIDDLANFIPARLTAPLIALAAALLGQRPWASLRICWRDCRNHQSPNAAFAEAAMAGAMGVQVGGVNYYGGEALAKPTIGEARVPLASRHIPLANALMFGAAGLFLAAGLAGRAIAVHAWHLWRMGS